MKEEGSPTTAVHQAEKQTPGFDATAFSSLLIRKSFSSLFPNVGSASRLGQQGRSWPALCRTPQNQEGVSNQPYPGSAASPGLRSDSGGSRGAWGRCLVWVFLLFGGFFLFLFFSFPRSRFSVSVEAGGEGGARRRAGPGRRPVSVMVAIATRASPWQRVAQAGAVASRRCRAKGPAVGARPRAVAVATGNPAQQRQPLRKFLGKSGSRTGLRGPRRIAGAGVLHPPSPLPRFEVSLGSASSRRWRELGVSWSSAPPVVRQQRGSLCLAFHVELSKNIFRSTAFRRDFFTFPLLPAIPPLLCFAEG